MDECSLKGRNYAVRIINIIDEDFINYKKPSMIIEFPFCSLKCDKDYGQAICQNSPLLKEKIIDVSCETIIKRYLNNPITDAIICQGLEPIDSFGELNNFLIWLRNQYHCNDDVVIYTGYTKEELKKFDYINLLKNFDNIIIKYGRYIPNQNPHYDEVLGINLASDNQYAEQIS